MDFTLNIQHSISNWIKEEKHRNISQLSSLSGISRATLKNIEMGRNTPRIQTAYKILKVTEGQKKASDLIKPAPLNIFNDLVGSANRYSIKAQI